MCKAVAQGSASKPLSAKSCLSWPREYGLPKPKGERSERAQGPWRLGAATVVLGTLVLFFVVAASTGLVPGLAPSGHGYNG